ncbi:5'-3' exonuclease H3TH domain-containing protein [Buchnera aphidicola]|uniref:5'-3' exonuclease n=1 Tax=Buchnera aphidicola TaxID=9 RepID=UPI003464C739
MQYIKKNPIIIIDGSLYLYRSYYAFPDYINTLGEPYGAIYGMLQMIYNILKKYHNINKMIVVFDESKKTFRNDLFKDYKKNRSRMPNTLAIQIPPLLEIMKKIGVKTFSIPGVEADDIIGSLAHTLESTGENVLIISNDKDMLQLVTKNIYIFQKNKNLLIKPNIIKDIYGINPKEFIDFLALMGDPSDNIPGVPKIGKKTALFLLHNFYNLKNIYNNIEKISTLSLRNSKNISIELKKNKDMAFLSYQLAKIKLNININITLQDMTIKNSYKKNLFYFLRLCNFNKNKFYL